MARAVGMATSTCMPIAIMAIIIITMMGTITTTTMTDIITTAAPTVTFMATTACMSTSIPLLVAPAVICISARMPPRPMFRA